MYALPSTLHSNVNKPYKFTERTCTGLTAGGSDWQGPKVHPKAILKTSTPIVHIFKTLRSSIIHIRTIKVIHTCVWSYLNVIPLLEEDPKVLIDQSFRTFGSSSSKGMPFICQNALVAKYLRPQLGGRKPGHRPPVVASR